jgi:hypothetical protein
MTQPINSLIFALLLIFGLLIGPSKGDEKIVYEPHWSISDNGGAVKLNTLAPLYFYSPKEKTEKTPLILVHGILSDSKPYCNWGPLIKWLKDNNQLDQYAVYIYRYSSFHENFERDTKILSLGLDQLNKDYPKNKNFKFVATSFGGILLREALKNNEDVLDRTEVIISIGAPYLGTPLLAQSTECSKCSKDEGHIFHLILHSTKSLFKGMCQALVDFPQAYEEPSKEFEKEYKSKHIYYAAYVNSTFLESKKNCKGWHPYKTAMEMFPDGGYKQSWNLMMHYVQTCLLAQEPKYKNYGVEYNDGLVPVYSATYSGQYGKGEITDPSLKIRLFKGFDHTEMADNHATLIMEDINSGRKDVLASFIADDLKK